MTDAAQPPHAPQSHPAARRASWRMTQAALLVTLLLGSAPARAQDGAAAFLVQQNCVDPSGTVRPGVLPFALECTVRRPAAVGDALGYRKHDWPGVEHRAAAPLGYQASDSLLGTLWGRPAALITFDFGTVNRRFGVFDAGADGGDAIAFEGERAISPFSEDSAGLHWFLSPRCRPAGPVASGWLYFDRGDGVEIAELAIAPAARACPRAFSRALTLWRRVAVDMPYLLRGNPAGRFPAEAIVSDHFSHPTIADSMHLERFWFARGLGRVRWERWENLPRHAAADAAR